MMKRLLLPLVLLAAITAAVPPLAHAAAPCPAQLAGTFTFVVAGSDLSRASGTITFTADAGPIGSGRWTAHGTTFGTTFDLRGGFTMIGDQTGCSALLLVERPGQDPVQQFANVDVPGGMLYLREAFVDNARTIGIGFQDRARP